MPSLSQWKNRVKESLKKHQIKQRPHMEQYSKRQWAGLPMIVVDEMNYENSDNDSNRVGIDAGADKIKDIPRRRKGFLFFPPLVLRQRDDADVDADAIEQEKGDKHKRMDENGGHRNRRMWIGKGVEGSAHNAGDTTWVTATCATATTSTSNTTDTITAATPTTTPTLAIDEDAEPFAEDSGQRTCAYVCVGANAERGNRSERMNNTEAGTRATEENPPLTPVYRFRTLDIFPRAPCHATEAMVL
ncbi:hypothetical protein FBU30_005157 [Linnemannia zychae]|nr:hypothetical protein FBU30_005157 [Linnemannia zychae]